MGFSMVFVNIYLTAIFAKCIESHSKIVPKFRQNPRKIDQKLKNPAKNSILDQHAPQNRKKCEKLRKMSQHEPTWSSKTKNNWILDGIREAHSLTP